MSEPSEFMEIPNHTCLIKKDQIIAIQNMDGNMLIWLLDSNNPIKVTDTKTDPRSIYSWLSNNPECIDRGARIFVYSSDISNKSNETIFLEIYTYRCFIKKDMIRVAQVIDNTLLIWLFKSD